MSQRHQKLVSVLIVLWLVCYTRFVYAVVVLAPFTQDVRGFDFDSLLTAMGAGLLGGAGRTIYSLASERVLVGSIWREGIKDGILALMGGAVAWFAVTNLAAYFPTILTREFRMLAIVAAGASRGAWADWVGGFIGDGLSAFKARMVDNIRGRTPGDAGPSAVSPLSDTSTK